MNGNNMKGLHERLCTDEGKSMLGLRRGNSKKELVDTKRKRTIDAAEQIMSVEPPDDELEYETWKLAKIAYTKTLQDIAAFTDQAALITDIKKRCLDLRQRKHIIDILEPALRRSLE